MKMKTKIIGVLLAILLIVSTTAVFEVAQRSVSPLELSSGLRMIYQLTIGGANSPSQRNAEAFSIALANSYQYILRANVTQSRECKIDADSVFLTLQVGQRTSGSWPVNVTLTFRNGSAVCGLGFGALPNVNSRWVLANGSYVGSFDSLNITKTVSVNASSDIASGPEDSPYGSWPLWLDTSTLEEKYPFITYGLLDNVSGVEPATGLADVIFLNRSVSAPTDYLAAGVEVPADGQFFSNTSAFPRPQVIHNIPRAVAEEYIAAFLKQRTECLSIPRCSISLSEAFAPKSGPNNFYSNGSLYVDYSPLFLNATRLETPCGFVSKYSAGSTSINLNGSSFQDYYYESGLSCGGTRYLSVGFQPIGILLNASYSRSGVLLYANVDARGNVLSALPTPVTRAFGVINDFNNYAGEYISFRLIGFTPAS